MKHTYKSIQNYSFLLFSFLCIIACSDENFELGEMIIPTNSSINATPSTDGSGMITFDVSADNVFSYGLDLGNGDVKYFSSTPFTYMYGNTGTYTTTLTPYGEGGIEGATSSATFDIEVDFALPENFIELLTNNSSKTWYWAASSSAYLGIGPSDSKKPDWYSSAPFEHESKGCLFDDTFMFSYDGTNVTYNYNNNGASFYNADFSGAGEDSCVDVDTSGDYSVILGLSADTTLSEDESTKVNMSFGGSGEGKFMGYYVKGTNYEIVELTTSTMNIRFIDYAGRAWYQKFSTIPTN